MALARETQYCLCIQQWKGALRKSIILTVLPVPPKYHPSNASRWFRASKCPTQNDTMDEQSKLQIHTYFCLCLCFVFSALFQHFSPTFLETMTSKYYLIFHLHEVNEGSTRRLLSRRLQIEPRRVAHCCKLLCLTGLSDSSYLTPLSSQYISYITSAMRVVGSFKSSWFVHGNIID